MLRVSLLALPAFLASAAGTALLQAEILPIAMFQKILIGRTIYSCGRNPSDPLPLKQSSWDRPGIEKDQASIESGLSTPLQRATFNAARSSLPITSCGLKFDDEEVRVAVGTRLALKLCITHPCRCGSKVDSFGRHSLVCKRAPGRTVRDHHLNDVIARSLASAGVPVSKEPSGLSRSDGKRPDGLTLIRGSRAGHLYWM